MDDLLKRLDECAAEKHRAAWSDMRGGHDLTIGAQLAEEAAARIRELEARYTNCAVCGRVVDTREKDEGVDGHGCQYGDKWACSTECAETLHPDPQWMKDAMNAAQLAATAVKVKPLVWREGENSVFLHGAGGGNSYTIMPTMRGGFRVYGVPGNSDGAAEKSTVESAKAAAQADYEARILAAIEAVPVAEVWRRATEAAEQSFIGCFGGEEHAPRWIVSAIRATPMPDDMR